MRREGKKQKKVKVEAGKKKSGFDAEDEEEDVSVLLIYTCCSIMVL